jgi:hypothetical protein
LGLLRMFPAGQQGVLVRETPGPQCASLSSVLTTYISYPSFHPRYLYLHILSTRDSELGLGLPLRVVINPDCSALALSCQCTTSHLQWPKTPRAAGQTGIFIACEKAVAALIRRDSEYRHGVRMFPSQLAVIMMSTALVSYYSNFNLTCTWSGQGTLAVTSQAVRL